MFSNLKRKGTMSGSPLPMFPCLVQTEIKTYDPHPTQRQSRWFWWAVSPKIIYETIVQYVWKLYQRIGTKLPTKQIEMLSCCTLNGLNHGNYLSTVTEWLSSVQVNCNIIRGISLQEYPKNSRYYYSWFHWVCRHR